MSKKVIVSVKFTEQQFRTIEYYAGRIRVKPAELIASLTLGELAGNSTDAETMMRHLQNVDIYVDDESMATIDGEVVAGEEAIA